MALGASWFLRKSRNGDKVRHRACTERCWIYGVWVLALFLPVRVAVAIVTATIARRRVQL